MVKKIRKRKLKLKNISLLIIFIVVAVVGITQFQNIKIYYLAKTTEYSEKSITTFLEKDIYNDIKDKKYSKTLEKIINTDEYNQKYLKDYIEIKYYNKKNYLQNINSLLNLGYKSNEINDIYELLSEGSINLLIENEYIKDITNIIKLNYFEEEKLNRYIEYYRKEELSVEDIITYVNIGLDKKYYTNVTKIEDQHNLLVLVNKYNQLNSTFTPKNLKVINSKYQWHGRSNQLTKEAALAFEEMCEAAKKENIYIYAGSGYRSYASQKYIYNNYVATDGFDNAETYSARPGYSEHQTGLAMDIANTNDFIDKNDKEYKWLINNSYKYGFILRYPEYKDTLTGYMYEEWHYRYVSKEIAKKVYESGLTYDEFIARKMN